MIKLNYLMDHVLIIELMSSLSSKNKTLTNNPPIRIYINKVENIITFKIKAEYYNEHLTPEMMNLLGSTKSKYKDEIGENVSHVEITEALLVYCNIDNSDY